MQIKIINSSTLVIIITNMHKAYKWQNQSIIRIMMMAGRLCVKKSHKIRFESIPIKSICTHTYDQHLSTPQPSKEVILRALLNSLGWIEYVQFGKEVTALTLSLAAPFPLVIIRNVCIIWWYIQWCTKNKNKNYQIPGLPWWHVSAFQNDFYVPLQTTT